MNRADIVAFIKRRLGFYTKKDEDIEAEIGHAQEELEQGVQSPLPGIGTFLPWFLVREQQTISTTASEERLVLPTGFLRENESAALWRYDSADTEDPWKELAKDEIDFLRDKYPEPGVPLAYANLGDYFRLAPVPDAIYTIKVIVFTRDVVLSSTVLSNLWTTHAPHLLASTAGLELAIALRDAAAQRHFEQIRARSIQRLFTDTEARQHVNRRIVMGGQD